MPQSRAAKNLLYYGNQLGRGMKEAAMLTGKVGAQLSGVNQDFSKEKKTYRKARRQFRALTKK